MITAATSFTMKPMLAEVWDGEMDPTGWWLSEKYDGYRAIWDGRRLMSRNGNYFLAPLDFLVTLPGTAPLDGELWLGRGRINEMWFVRSSPNDPRWRQVKFMVFDVPMIDTEVPFESRISALKRMPRRASWAEVEHQQCRGRTHLLEELDRVVSLGGEGLMIRMPGSVYEQRRTDAMLKVLPF